ncbi:glutaredoxin family protein [Candidatus Falkowbacteria bacterium]|nr:glutaredoxin family protein [Candidatus Falkowbacteria bacterium]
MNMKKIFIIIAILIPIIASASPPIDVYLFVTEDCPYCEQASYLLNAIQKDQPSINIHQYEVSHNSDNAMLFAEFAKAYDTFATDTPITFVGDKSITGYYPEKIKAQIDKCLEKICPAPQDILEQYLSKSDASAPTHNYRWLWATIIVLCIFGTIGIYLTKEKNKNG